MVPDEEVSGVVHWLRDAAEAVRRFARHAMAAPPWWGDFPLATLLDALAQSAEKTLVAGGSTTEEPYRSSLVLAKRIIEVAEMSQPPR
ncbi:hypothetical protein ACTXG6_36915 [Pseudonocardia sp. Cha107L01]|uniref:hypothetical protein n=1 Tax=Pseudonocardia sp. Cha107L01 TaxID=3457576 RepID=UPI00403E5B6B